MTFFRKASAPYYRDVHTRGFSSLFCLSWMALLAVTVVCGCNRGAHPAQVGRKAPDFTVSDGTNTIKLSNYRGHTVLLNFWASWCGPCIEEEPGLEQLHHDRPDITILAVSVDTDRNSYQRFLRQFQVDIPTVMDPDQKASSLYHTDGWPESYIIDRNGIIRRKVVGNPDWSNPEMRAFLSHM